MDVEQAPARRDNGRSATTAAVQQPQHCHWSTKMLKFISRIYSHLGLYRLQRQARKPELVSKNCRRQQNPLSLTSINLRLFTHAEYGIITYPGFGAQNCWDWLLRSS